VRVPAPPRLVTRRLVIRTATASDVPALVAFHRSEGPERGRFAPRRPRAWTDPEWIRRQVGVLEGRRCAGEGVVLFLFAKDAPAEIAGNVSLSNVVRGAFQAAHLGYALRSHREGQGLMAEALRAIVPWAFRTLRLHRLMANHMPSNRRSARLLRRLGFRREGIAREYLLVDGRWEDHVLTSLVNPAWTPPPGDAAARAAAARTRSSRSRRAGRGR
jgi:ribosomal-protein-alanine N-acetyltransferase